MQFETTLIEPYIATRMVKIKTDYTNYRKNVKQLQFSY
jgi:hypothetical protein